MKELLNEALSPIALDNNQEYILGILRKCQSAERKGKKFIVENLAISAMTIDETYQRLITRINEITDIVKVYNPVKVDIKKVSIRQVDGVWYLFLLDGRHTKVVETLMGHKAMWCQVYWGLTLEEEALMFATQNEGKTTIKGYDLLKAEYTAKVDRAVAIMNSLKKNKSSVKDSDNVRNINSVQLLYRAEKLYGAESIDFIFKVYKAAGWIDMKTAYTQRLLNVFLCYPYCKKNKDAYARLVSVMSQYTPVEFAAMAIDEGNDINPNAHPEEQVRDYYLRIVREE